MKNRRVSSGREGGWILLAWLLITAVFGIPVLSQNQPRLEDLHSYEAILNDCTIFQDTPRRSSTYKAPHKMAHILIAMKSTCPITGPNIKSVSTFEMLPPRNVPEEEACGAVNQYKGEILKIYYSTNPDYIRYTTAAAASYPLWQIDYKGAPVVTFNSQIEAWRAEANGRKFWFFIIFCVPALLMTIGYIFKIRQLS